MRILILDDDESRLRQFRQILSGNEVTCVKTAKETIEKLSENETYDVIFLDHDLGGKVYAPSGEETGYEVAEWISENPNREPKQIIIHSFNNVGARNMKNLLPNAVLAPGAWTKINKNK